MKSRWMAVIGLVAGCASGGVDQEALDEEWGMAGAMSPTPPVSTQDGELRRGIPVSTNTTRTQVWIARNRWEDRTTTAARAAGLAWAAESGLSWDDRWGGSRRSTARR